MRASALATLAAIPMVATSIVATPGAARADPLELAGPPANPRAEAEPSAPLSVDVDAGIGFSAGATQIGSHTYAQVGARVSLGLRVGRLAIGGAYETGSTNRGTGEDLINGQRHRFSLAASAEVHRWGGGLLFGETRLGAGVGREFVAWEQGALSRRDVFAVIEQGIGFHIQKERSRSRRVLVGPEAMLYSFGLQLTGSRTPPLAFQPLSSSSKTGGELDLGFLFTMGLQFRR